ncbi:MAG TPA: hypothetical protein DEP05_07570 [Betaproteobacteria bacterium]|nr:hypothetical protein [Betaproteobacteria bacterium]
MNRPTVAHLLPAYNPFPPVYPAGTELRVEQVSLRQQRYRPTVICAAFKGQPAQETTGVMTIRRIATGRVYRRLFQKITRLDPSPYTARMWRIVQQESARLIHIHNEPKLLTGLAPYLEKSPLPTVVHVANEKPLPKNALSLVARWVACSRYIKQWIAGNGVPPEKIAVVYTGVDTAGRPAWWDVSPERRAALRRHYGIVEDNAAVILFAGRLVKEKGVIELLDAFAQLRASTTHPLYLLVAGNVRASNDPKNEKAAYGRAVVERMAREPRVQWVGSLAPAEMHDFLLAGDLFALTSIWPDPFPTVMLEAAAAGLPILGSALGGIVEFLDGCPGVPMIHEPESAQRWAEGLAPLVENVALRHEAGRWLRAKVDADFGWDRVARDFEALYDSLLTTP